MVANETKILRKEEKRYPYQKMNGEPESAVLYEVIRSNPDFKIRRDAAIKLLKLIQEGNDVDLNEITQLFDQEKNVSVATELKRVINKIKIKHIARDDPTSKYDRQLTADEENRLDQEINRLIILYDKSVGEVGSFKRKYKVLEEIAVGGMGRVFWGIRRSDQREIAIKYLLLDELSRKNDRQGMIPRFKREAQILNKLDHPNIIKAFEYGEADEGHFLVMEYLGGGTLEALIQREPLPIRTFMEISSQLCDAVGYIHKNGIIHRDIKPGNILLTREEILSGKGNETRFGKGYVNSGKTSNVAVGLNGHPNLNPPLITIKLADFGLAKDKTGPKLSMHSFQAGTDEYSSTQQLLDAREADERDDIFSMGKTFYELLTQQTFKNDEPYQAISQLNPAVPGSVESIIKKCIEFKKMNRFQRVSELKDSLNAFWNGGSR